MFCVFVLFFAKVTTAQTFTFSNAGASGTEGPTQTQIDSSYTANQRDMLRSIQGEFRNGSFPFPVSTRLKYGVQKAGQENIRVLPPIQDLEHTLVANLSFLPEIHLKYWWVNLAKTRPIIPIMLVVVVVVVVPS